jgi:hypothetical protein
MSGEITPSSAKPPNTSSKEQVKGVISEEFLGEAIAYALKINKDEGEAIHTQAELDAFFRYLSDKSPIDANGDHVVYHGSSYHGKGPGEDVWRIDTSKIEGGKNLEHEGYADGLTKGDFKWAFETPDNTKKDHPDFSFTFKQLKTKLHEPLKQKKEIKATAAPVKESVKVSSLNHVEAPASMSRGGTTTSSIDSRPNANSTQPQSMPNIEISSKVNLKNPRLKTNISESAVRAVATDGKLTRKELAKLISTLDIPDDLRYFNVTTLRQISYADLGPAWRALPPNRKFPSDRFTQLTNYEKLLEYILSTIHGATLTSDGYVVTIEDLRRNYLLAGQEDEHAKALASNQETLPTTLGDMRAAQGNSKPSPRHPT